MFIKKGWSLSTNKKYHRLKKRNRTKIDYLKNRFISLHTITICLSVNVTDEGNHNPLSEKVDACLYTRSGCLYGFNLWIAG